MRDGINVGDIDSEYMKYTTRLIEQIDPVTQKDDTIPERRLETAHPWHGVSHGPNFPDVITAVIEIPAHSRVKTTLDLPSGLLRVDRILHSFVVYPANYGFIPQTLAGDHNPLDILVLCQLSVPPLSLLKARPIGLIPMSTDGNIDNKIIAVSVGDPEFNIYHSINELPPFKLLMINQFFNDYKKLERKTVVTMKPQGPEEAKKLIVEYVNKYKEAYK